MIREQIDKILEKYYHETDENFTAHRYEEDENGEEQEIYFEDELKAYCQENKVSYKYECTSAYNSCGYDCSVGTIAFIDENSELQLMAVLYEYF